jgi:hypothetical protein
MGVYKKNKIYDKIYFDKKLGGYLWELEK